MDHLKHSSAGRQLIPMEASVAWPVPYRAGGHSFVILPIYTRAPTRGGQCAIFPWTSAFTLNWRTGILVEYVDFRFRSAWSGIDFSQPLTLAGTDDAKTARDADCLARMYDQLLDSLMLKASLPPFWARSFREALSALVEPTHYDFYRQIAPRFYERYLMPV